jgi:cysteinyl-tRNA synthetase
VTTRVEEARQAFRAHIAADLNTAAGIGVIFDLVRALNSSIDHGEMGQADAPVVREAFAEFDRVLGVLSLRAREDQEPPVPIAEIEALIEARRAARLARNFVEADRIRKDLEGRGIMLEDTGPVTRWKRR